MRDRTKSFVEPGSEEPGQGGWYLVLALDAMRPFGPTERVALAGLDAVTVGRGEARRLVAGGAALRMDLDDPFLSHEHFRLARDQQTWRLIDCGSKNGTLVSGKNVDDVDLADGSVVEAGATFMVLRRAEASVAKERAAFGIATWNPDLESRLALAARVARSRLAILIRGESGTGKEVAARAIHALSGRAGPFIPVNCGALPVGIAEAELFGARRGAYTGAVDDHPGLVRAADRGTLFLDEVADLPPPAQAALLRLLQEGELRQLGANRVQKIDVRVVSATHRDLDALVAQGDFRRDLRARITGHVLGLPPLRARREDLGRLCAELLARIDETKRPERRFARDAARALFAYDWPNNVRELEHVLAAACAVTDGEIRLRHLPSELLHVRHVKAPLPSVSRGARRELLVRLLDEHAGNVSAVARALGTSRSQVRRLAEKYGIEIRAKEPD